MVNADELKYLLGFGPGTPEHEAAKELVVLRDLVARFFQIGQYDHPINGLNALKHRMKIQGYLPPGA